MGISWKKANEIVDSMKPISFKQWNKMFEKSSSIHLAGATRKYLSTLIIDDPQYSVYALLGPRYCPRSYYSVKYF